MSGLPHHCNGCTTRWNGANTAHCAACHTTFTGITAFDRHRVGSHAAGKRHCLTPDAVGLVLTGRAYPCWGEPGDNTFWEDTE